MNEEEIEAFVERTETEAEKLLEKLSEEGCTCILVAVIEISPEGIGLIVAHDEDCKLPAIVERVRRMKAPLN